MLLQAEDAAGGPVDHPGAMLFSFLRRYGMDWNLNKDAVAVAQGGVVSRSSLATVAGPFAGQDKLAVKDPLTGVFHALVLAPCRVWLPSMQFDATCSWMRQC